MLKCFLFALAVGVVIHNVKGKQLSSEELDRQLEPECARQGGICMSRSECPKGFESDIGYCPMQRRQGVICCNGLPISERRCQRLGGECMPSCPDIMRISKANDCSYTEPACCLQI